MVASRLFALSNSRLRRAISACSVVSLPIFSPGFFPSRTPASRYLRHSLIRDEYRRSRRRYAPTVALAGLFIGGQVGELVSGAEGASSLRAFGAWVRGPIRTLSSTRAVGEIVIAG